MDLKSSFTLSSLLLLAVANTLLVVVVLAVAPGVGAIVGTAAVITLGAWFGVRSLGVRAIERAAQDAPAPAPVAPAPEPKRVEPPRPPKPEQPPEASAIQLLGLFQREGRLVDFLQQDLAAFDDAQIGAAVRTVHEGCKKALDEHVTLEPIMKQPEGSTVTVEPGFDARRIRLSGHVAGDPPFTGTLQHRGWHVARIQLPELMQKQDRTVAAAEVEVGA